MNEKIYHFGPFELSAGERVLRQGEEILPIPPKAMAALLVLVRAEGRVVSKAELISQVWPDTFVEEGTLAQTVSILRRQLKIHKNGESPIETISRVGYRVRIPITVRQAELEPELGPGSQAAVESSEAGVVVLDAPTLEEPGAVPAGERRWADQFWLFAALGVFLVLGVAGFLLRHRLRAGLPLPSSAAVKPREVSAPLLYPVTSEPEGEKVTAAAVSPDGLKVAYSDRAGISVHTFSGGELLLPSRPSFAVDRIAWLPDNAHVLMSGVDESTHQHQVWEIPLVGGFLRQIVADADLAVASPDDTLIAYTRKHDREIWLAGGSGENPRRLISDAAGSFPYLIWSPAGDRLLLDHKTARGDAYESIDARTGALLDREAGYPFLSGYLLPSGLLCFSVKDLDDPFGAAVLVTVPTDLHTGRFLAKPRVVEHLTGLSRSLSASTDGKRFAEVRDRSTVGVFVANLHQPEGTLDDMKKLLHGERESYPHAWTADGESVILENMSLGKWAIFTQQLDGSAPKLAARLADSIAMEQLTPDGRWIMFQRLASSTQPGDALYRVPVTGGAIERVPASGSIEDFRCSISAAGRCVLRQVVGNTEVIYRELDPVSGMGRELARVPWQPMNKGDWGLSPDGTTVAATDHDTVAPEVRLVKLRGQVAGTAGVTERPLRGHGTLLTSGWAADGRSLFVECRTEEGFALVNLDFAGHIKLLRKSEVPIWAIPSRDGRRLAFPGRTASSNVWTSEIAPD